MQFEIIVDPETGTEVLMLDSCEAAQWRPGDAPAWVGPVKTMMAEREATAIEAGKWLAAHPAAVL